MKKSLFIFLIFLFFAIPCSFAEKNTIKLLAVDEATEEGTIVNLDLEIKEGSGKIFIETYPLSQIDTQISLRTAKIIACKTTEKYCPGKDFVYSIKASSPVVAGPSAGASMALLTLASLENKKINPEIIMTGTINSGGVIGVVGSIKEKIKAAAESSMKTVLIPRGEENATELIAYGNEINITVIEITDLEEAYEFFTGEKISYPSLRTNREYEAIMKNLNEEICRRTHSIMEEIKNYTVSKHYSPDIEKGTNLTMEAAKLYSRKLYYSSASRCFGANVYFREVLLSVQNITGEIFNQNVKDTEKAILSIETELNSTKINNLGDLETAMIVRERIFDARENLKLINETHSLRELSYAVERVYSADAWKQFFGFSGKEIDETKLKESCILKLEEVQELYNYVSIYFPMLLQESKRGLDAAKEYFNSGDYILCLFKASKSEAEVNAALSTLYIKESSVESLLENKISAAKKAIQKQVQKDIFPILGYSYYEYSTALDENENYVRLLYAEYGIELSNLDIYFPAKKPFGLRINENALLTLILGFIMGITLFLIRKPYKRKKIVLKRR